MKPGQLYVVLRETGLGKRLAHYGMEYPTGFVPPPFMYIIIVHVYTVIFA